MEDLIQDLLVNYIIPGLVTATGSLVVYGLTQLSLLLKSKTHDARFHCAIERLTDLATQAVREQEQIFVKEMKKKGQWDAATMRVAKKRATNVVKRHLGPRGFGELQGCLGHKGKEGAGVIEGMVDSAVEASVAKLREGRTELRGV